MSKFFAGVEVIESEYVPEGAVYAVNLRGDKMPPMMLKPGQTESTPEERIAHIIRHGGVLLVKNIGKFEENLKRE